MSPALPRALSVDAVLVATDPRHVSVVASLFRPPRNFKYPCNVAAIVTCLSSTTSDVHRPCAQEFLQVIEKQRDSAGESAEDWDMVSAFVALGGNADKTGGLFLAARLVVLLSNAYSPQIPRSPEFHA